MRIAIVGGGLGGLTLARILHRHGLEATVYEREPDRFARTQGGMLDLHPESGQLALEAAGLTAGFRAEARPEGEELRILDPSGRTLLHHRPEPGSFARPEIDRGALRDLLLDSLPDGTVAWGHRLAAVTSRPGGRGFRLAFDTGIHQDCDVLVGADGARSAVRPLLTDAPLTGLATLAELTIDDADDRHPAVAELVGPGNLWCLGDRRILAAQRQPGGRIRVGVSLPAADHPELYRRPGALLALFDGWDRRLTALITAAAGPPSIRRIEAMPTGTRWEHRPGLTLIGDAAHLMPPVGEGANQAMLDAAELGAELATDPTDPDAAIRRYEAAMFERIRPVAEMSARVQAMMLSPTAAEDIIRFFTPQPA